MAYSNPLASRLALGVEDIKREGKLFTLCADLERKIRTPLADVPFAWRIKREALPAAEALMADWSGWEAFDDHTVWARKQDHSWFAAEVVVPEAARGKILVMRFSSQWQDRLGSTDPQCLVYLDGRIAQALDGNHTELVIEAEAVPGNRHVILINAFTFFERPLVGFGVDFLTRDRRIESLYYDLMTPLEVAVRLHQTDARRHAILDLVERALRALDRRGHQTDGLWETIGEAEAIAARIYALVDTEVQPQVTAVGSTHLDVGWLWRVIHTRDKTARSLPLCSS